MCYIYGETRRVLESIYTLQYFQRFSIALAIIWRMPTPSDSAI